MTIEPSRTTVSNIVNGHWPLILILTLYLTAGVVLFRVHDFPFANAETDGIGYLERAEGAILQAHPFHPPGYSTSIRCLKWLPGVNAFAAAKLVSLLSGSAVVALCWFLFRSLLDRWEAAVATALLASNWLVLLYGTAILSDMLGAVFFLASLVVLLVAKQAGWKRFAISGLLAGAAYLTRYAYVFLVLLPILHQAFQWREERRMAPLARNVCSFFLGFLFVTLPWLLFLTAEKGDPFWSESHLVLAQHIYGGDSYDLYPDLRERFNSTGDVVMSDPALFFSTWWEMIRGLPRRFRSFFPAIGFLVPLGLIFWISSLSTKKTVFLGMSLVCICFTGLIHYEGRYFIPVIPMMAAAIATCLFGIRRAALKLPLASRIPKPVADTILAVVFVGYLLLLVKGSFGSLRNAFAEEAAEEYRMTAEFLTGRIGEGDRVAAAKPHIPYFTGSAFSSFSLQLHLEDREVSDLPSALAENGVSYFLFDERIGAVSWPRYAFLLDTEKNPWPDVLDPIYECDSPKKMVVYRVRSNL